MRRIDRVAIDTLNKRALVSSGGQFLIIDLSNASNFGPGYPDDNLDNEDDRIVWRSPGGLYPQGGGRLLAFDTERGLVHVSVGPPVRRGRRYRHMGA